MLVATNSCLIGFKAYTKKGNHRWYWKPGQISDAEITGIRKQSTIATLLDQQNYYS